MTKEINEDELAKLKIEFDEVAIWLYEEDLMEKYEEAKKEVNIFKWDDEVAWYKKMINLMMGKLRERYE